MSGADGTLLGHEAGEGRGRQRLAEVEALRLLAAGCLQELDGLLGLDAFRADDQAQRFGQQDDGLGDGSRVAVAVGDQRAIELQLVQRHAIELFIDH